MSKKQKKIIKELRKLLKQYKPCPILDSDTATRCLEELLSIENPYLFDTKSTPKSFKPKSLDWWDAHITNKLKGK